MKKLFLTMLVVLVSMSAMAQDKKFGLGFNLLYGTKIENVGFGVKGQYYASEAVRLEANVDYFMKNKHFKKGDKEDEVTSADVNVVAHYLIPTGSKMYLYPIAGVGLSLWHYSVLDNDRKVSINLGAGYQFDIAEDFVISAEAKYQIIDSYNQAVFAVGAAYKF